MSTTSADEESQSFLPIEWLTGDAFNFYCWACGALLARAHAKTSEAAIIAGYCGTSKPAPESLADWAKPTVTKLGPITHDCVQRY